MKRGLLIFFVIVIFSGIVYFQNRLSDFTGQKIRVENLTMIPCSESVKNGLLGFETTFSHILWIKTVLYFGGHYLTDKDYPLIVKLVDMVTKINPHFYPAYEFAGIMIPEICNDPDAARVILERGLFHIGDKKWNIAFYLSMLFYKYYGENEIAAEFMAVASRVEGAPQAKLVAIAAALYKKAGMEKTADDFLVLIYQASENPEIRLHLSEKIMELQNRLRKGSVVLQQ